MACTRILGTPRIPGIPAHVIPGVPAVAEIPAEFIHSVPEVPAVPVRYHLDVVLSEDQAILLGAMCNRTTLNPDHETKLTMIFRSLNDAGVAKRYMPDGMRLTTGKLKDY